MGGGLLNYLRNGGISYPYRTRMEVEKLKYKKLEVMQPRIKNKSDLKHTGSVQMKFYSRD